MKKYLLLVLSSVSLCYGQIPAGYYNTATGTGYTLKTNLHNIINNNTNTTTNANYGDLWTLYSNSALRDNYYENNASLLDIYSENPSGPDSYEYTSSSQQCGGSTPSNEGSCYNREHIIPQSVFGSDYPMYSDAHFVLPSDNRVNGWRNNYPFGKVVTTTGVPCTNASAANTVNTPCFTTNTSRLGQNQNSGYTSGYSGIVFEPIDEFKGDVARAILYFVTCYQDRIPSYTYSMFDGTVNQSLNSTFLNIMLKWHNDDPVSAYEIAKNNAVYTHQNNRNPYIDRPEFVCQIWPTQCAALSSESFLADNAVSIYPNPTNSNEVEIFTTESIIKLTLVNINGQIIKEIDNPIFNQNTYKLNNLPQGFYFLQISAENGSLTKKIMVN